MYCFVPSKPQCGLCSKFASKAGNGWINYSVAGDIELSISTLTARTVMLQQLSAEVLKMKRFLLELKLVVVGEKQLDA
jgi:hypothetical protein